MVIIKRRDDLYIGFVPSVPGAASFATTETELIENLKDAILCINRVKEEILK
jgi:predicted RNase H-like HicB family nuclease